MSVWGILNALTNDHTEKEEEEEEEERSRSNNGRNILVFGRRRARRLFERV